jgi:hypothetical protein
MCWVFGMWRLCRAALGSCSELNKGVMRCACDCLCLIAAGLDGGMYRSTSLQSRQTAVSDRYELTEDYAI